MTFRRNEEAVSPVIGIILMVAVTVILAAIIASFVFGSTTNVQKTRVVAASAQIENMGSIVIVYQGGQDDDALTNITITAPNSTIWHLTDSDGTLANSGSTFAKPDVGTTMKLYPTHPSDWPSGQKHIIVVGAFNDGSSHVFLDTYV